MFFGQPWLAGQLSCKKGGRNDQTNGPKGAAHYSSLPLFYDPIFKAATHGFDADKALTAERSNHHWFSKFSSERNNLAGVHHRMSRDEDEH